MLGISKAKLAKYMWGDFVYNAKTKSVSPWTSASKEPPIFVKMVLSAVWRVYKSIYKRNDDALRSILDTIGVSLTPRGAEMARKMDEAAREVDRLAASLLSADEEELLKNMLASVRRAMTETEEK